MKKLFLILIPFLTIGSEYIYSQQDTTNSKSNRFQNFITKNDIQLIAKGGISPLPPAIRRGLNASVILEVCFKHRHSIQFTGLDGSYNKSNSNIKEQKTSFQIIPEYKFFVSKKKQYAGFYIGAYFKLATYSYKNETNIGIPAPYTYIEYNQSAIGGGAIIGYQNYIKKRFVIDLICGYGVRQIMETAIIKEVNTKLDNRQKTFPDYRLSLNIGYRFFSR